MIQCEFCYICYMGAIRSYSSIFRVQGFIVLVFYGVSMISLSIPLVTLVTAVFTDHFYPLVLFLLLYTVGVVVLGSLIHTVSYIPFHLATAFDPIKNDIAAGRIREMEDLGKRITQFTTDFFNFAFLDIRHAYFHTAGGGVISHEELPETRQAMQEFGMLELSKNLEQIARAGKITRGGRDYHLYILPVRFGDEWLGYLGLLTRHRISRFFQRYLVEFENNFLDDQVMLITRMQQ